MLLCLKQLQANEWKVQDMLKKFKVWLAHAIIDPTGHLLMPLKMMA
jgi:hypothetical protein